MPVTVGLQNVGSFQVAGWPYINTVTLNSSEQEFQFNFVSQEVTVWNSGGEQLEFYFTSGSSNAFMLPPGKKVTIRTKSGSIFAKSTSGTTMKIFVSMTNIPLERIGIIPTGPVAGPIPDQDGDGVPDYGDILPLFHGTPPPNASEWDKKGTEDLWMEINGSTEFQLESLTLFLDDPFPYPVLYPGLEAYYLNVDDVIIDYTDQILSPTTVTYNSVDTSVAGTYTLTYSVTKEFDTVTVDRQVIVLSVPQEQQPVLTQQMDGGDFSTLEFEGPTSLSSILLEQEGLEVNEYEDVEE
jgi:hypothetical protein